jgi:hypothetical protein
VFAVASPLYRNAGAGVVVRQHAAG